MSFNRQVFNLIVLCFVFTLFANVSFAAVGPNWIEQWGITWTFDKNISTDGATGTYRYGTFVNGDYWVIGPVGIISIIPLSQDSGGRIMNGSMLNPSPTNDSQGYDNAMYANAYSSSLNKAFNVTSSNPLLLQSGSSLVSTISHPTEGARPQLKAAAVLTVLSIVPSPGSFRPSYSGTDKTIKHNKSQLNYSTLKNLTAVTGTPVMATVAGQFERPWLDHKNSWAARFQHPSDNMPDYGQTMSMQIGDAALLLNLNYTNSDKEDLLVGLVQVGIDFYGIAEAGGYWPADGGQCVGRLLPIQLAGLVLGDEDMLAAAELTNSEVIESEAFSPQLPKVIFQELQNTFYVDALSVSITQSDNPTAWTPDEDGFGSPASDPLPYREEHIGLPEFGIRHLENPTRDNYSFDTLSTYRSINGTASLSHALAARIMGIKDNWNHDAFFDYMDRWYGITGGVQHSQSITTFTKNMWDTYRVDYGPIWPDTGTTYALTVNSSGASDVAISSSTGHGGTTSYTKTVTSDASVNLQTQQYVGSGDSRTRFDGWTGSVISSSQSITFTMDRPITLTANYVPDPEETRTLNLSKTGNGRVWVNDILRSLPWSETFAVGDNVILNAVPDTDWDFSGWYVNDTAESTSPTYSVLMDGDKAFIAKFETAVPSDSITPVFVMESETGFDKINDYKEVSLSNASAASGTVSLWAYGYDYSTSQYLFGHTVGSWSNRIQLYVRDSYLGLGLGDQNNRHANIQLLEPNQWYLITLSWDGTTYAVYVDGQQKATGIYTGLDTLNTFADAGNTGNPDSRTGEVFHGRIDDVEIYDTALSGTEVGQLYTEGRNGGLAEYLKMDDIFDNANPDIVTDDSGKNLETTTINLPQPTDAWAEEYCLRFNGTNQAVQISCDSMQAEAGTIAMKVQPSSATDTAFLFGHSLSTSQKIGLYTVAGKLALGLGDNLIVDSDIAMLSAGTLYHVALIWDGTNYAVYVDGQEESSGIFSGLTGLAVTADIANRGHFLGRSYEMGFDGIVDDVQIYSRALSAQEITTLFNTQEAKENRVLTFFISGQDQNGNPYTYTTQNLPAGAAFDQGEQKLTWRPWYDQAGDHQVLFISLDGADEQTVTLSVKDVTLRDWYREFLAQNGKL